MSINKPTDYETLSELLHDAHTDDIKWVPEESRLDVQVKCLRVGKDGKHKPSVTLSFQGVSDFGISYELSGNERPSSVPWPHAEKTLGAFINGGRRADIYYQSGDTELELDALSASGLGWIVGSSESFQDSNRHILVLETPTETKIDCITNLIIGADSFSAQDSGGPLGLEDWAKEFEGWWGGREEHWEKKGKEESPTTPFDTAIPLGPSDVDPAYRPPDEPVVRIDNRDLPDEVYQGVLKWFAEQHNSSELDQFLWPFGRALEEWWVDGERAFVRVRGIEHTAPCDDDPAENAVGRWDLRMRRRNSNWVVASWGGGSCIYYKEHRLPRREMPWLKEWKSGRVKTRRGIFEKYFHRLHQWWRWKRATMG